MEKKAGHLDIHIVAPRPFCLAYTGPLGMDEARPLLWGRRLWWQQPRALRWDCWVLAFDARPQSWAGIWWGLASAVILVGTGLGGF